MSSGTIIYCSREDAAPPMFAACLARLAQHHPDSKIIHMIGNDIADSRNKGVLQAEGDWVWFIDTDMLFAPNTVELLLARNVDIVQVLCVMRHPPHPPLMYETSATERDAAPNGPPRLVEVKSLGAGGTLYRKRVFEAVKGPWFEGVIGTEDTWFAQKARLAGFRLWVDTAVPVRHLTPLAVYPKYVNGVWCICYEAMNGESLLIPYDGSTLITRPELVKG
jgi:glycosyltransferase involved in cell wall biosynthesis